MIVLVIIIIIMTPVVLCFVANVTTDDPPKAKSNARNDTKCCNFDSNEDTWCRLHQNCSALTHTCGGDEVGKLKAMRTRGRCP